MFLPSRRKLVYGVGLPALVYVLIHFTVPAPKPQSRLAQLGIDPVTLDLDTISPRLAQMLGLRSKRTAVELVAVIISAQFCAANTVTGFSDAVAAVPGLLQAQVEHESEVVTRVIGISLDTDARTGSDYLFSLAAFDEIIAGGNWLNTATEKFLWAHSGTDVNIPQVLLLERSVTWSDAFPSLGTERVLQRLVGAEEIIEWVNRGAPARPITAPREGT